MTQEEWTALIRSEKEKRRRVLLERAFIDSDGLQHILTLDELIDLHRHVRDWLMRDWDPIGVSNVPEAVSEYFAYERGVADVLRMGTEEELAKHLNKIASEQMGLTRGLASDQVAARKLFGSYREWLQKRDQKNAS